jgi:hypothetical protein
MRQCDRSDDPESVASGQVASAPTPEGNNDTTAVNVPLPDHEISRLMAEKYKEAAERAQQEDKLPERTASD